MWNWINCYLSGRHDFGVTCSSGSVFLRCNPLRETVERVGGSRGTQDACWRSLRPANLPQTTSVRPRCRSSPDTSRNPSGPRNSAGSHPSAPADGLTSPGATARIAPCPSNASARNNSKNGSTAAKAHDPGCSPQVRLRTQHGQAAWRHPRSPVRSRIGDHSDHRGHRGLRFGSQRAGQHARRRRAAAKGHQNQRAQRRCPRMAGRQLSHRNQGSATVGPARTRIPQKGDSGRGWRLSRLLLLLRDAAAGPRSRR